jgi:peroxiredoxin
MSRPIPAFAAALFVLGCAGAATTQEPRAAAPAAADPFDSTPAEPSIAITADMGSPHVGDAAPDFELSDQDGAKLKLSSLRGKVVMLAFVSSWCPYSQSEQPHLAKLAADYAGDDRVKVIAVDVKEPDDGYQKYLRRVKMPLSVLRDATGEVTTSYAPPGAQPALKDRTTVLVTSNLVLDREGHIRFFTMADTVHFDARLVHARRTIDALLAEERRP